MREIKGDLWDFHAAGYWVLIPTNGMTNGKGKAVMGAGVALRAADWFPDFPAIAGLFLRDYGNIPGWFAPWRLITFPVKHDWRDPADPALIAESLARLHVDVRRLKPLLYDLDIAAPHVGCGKGGLSWTVDVKPIVESTFTALDITVVDNA